MTCGLAPQVGREPSRRRSPTFNKQPPARVVEVAAGMQALLEFKAWLRATFVCDRFTTPDDRSQNLFGPERNAHHQAEKCDQRKRISHLNIFEADRVSEFGARGRLRRSGISNSRVAGQRLQPVGSNFGP